MHDHLARPVDVVLTEISRVLLFQGRATMMVRHFLMLLLSMMLGGIFVLCGCAASPTLGLGEPVSVTGRVTMNGEPASGVEVIFSRNGIDAPPEYLSVSAMTDSSGSYTMERVFPAEYRVMLYKRIASKKETEAALENRDPYKQYGLQSRLKVKVGAGMTEHNFELKSDALDDKVEDSF